MTAEGTVPREESRRMSSENERVLEPVHSRAGAPPMTLCSAYDSPYDDENLLKVFTMPSEQMNGIAPNVPRTPIFANLFSFWTLLF